MPKEAINNNDGVYKFYKETVANSDEGKILKDKSRWLMFNPEGEEKTDEKEWQRVLGPDANNFGHMRLSFSTCGGFVDIQNRVYPENGFSEKDRLILRVVGAVHDLAEAKTGDIPFDFKTDDDDKNEVIYMASIVDKILKDNELGVEKEEIMEVLTNKESRLGKAFDAIEYIGYTRTGIKAWNKSERIKDEKLAYKLKALSSNVLGNNVIKLINLSGEYALVDHLINFYKDDINEAFEEMPKNVFDFYDNKKEKRKNIKKYKKAKKAWKKFEKETETKESSILAFNKMPSQR